MYLSFILILLFLVKFTHGAIVGVWSYSSTCSGSPSQTYIAFADVCTARIGEAITLSQCSSSNVKLYNYADSRLEKNNAPKCGTGTGTYVEASTTCTKFSDIGYVKLMESTCKLPNNVFIVNAQDSVCSSPSPYDYQTYTTVIADGSCQSWFESGSGYTYTANGGSSNTVDFKLFYSPICNISKLESVWDGIPTTGVCRDAVLKTSRSLVYRSALVAVPSAFLSAGAAIGAIVGSVIGVIVCCTGCWGALHACGVVNCPCFNRCCNRRKTVVTSSAPTVTKVSAPSQGYSSSQQPHYSAQPSYPTPQPTYSAQPQPSYPTQPSYSAQPTYPNNPTYPTQPQQTGFGQQTGYGQQAPQGYGQQAPQGYGQQAPQYGQAQQGYGQEQAPRRSSGVSNSPYGNVRL